MGTEENGSFPPHTTTAPAGNIADGRRCTSLDTLSKVAVKYGLF